MDSSPPRPQQAQPSQGGQRMNASQAMARLNAAVVEIEELKDAMSKSRADMAIILKALHLENGQLRAESSMLRQRVDLLETARGLEDDEGDGEGGGDVTGEGCEEGGSESEGERAKIMKSISVANSPPIKSAVNAVFKHLMGVSTLVPDKLPPHPHFPTGEEPPSVPIDAATGQPFLQFRWDKPAKHRDNVEGLKKVVTAVRTLGPTLYPAVAIFLPTLLEAHLEERVATKYRYLHPQTSSSARMASRWTTELYRWGIGISKRRGMGRGRNVQLITPE